MGGRRKSSLKPVVRHRPKLDKVFVCPMCSQEGAVCSINKGAKHMEGIAEVNCPACKKSHRFRGKVTYLTEAVDVFSDWLDFIANPTAKRPSWMSSSASSKTKKARVVEYEDDDAYEEEEEEEKPKPSLKIAPSGKKVVLDDSEDDDESEHEMLASGAVEEDDGDEEDEF